MFQMWQEEWSRTVALILWVSKRPWRRAINERNIFIATALCNHNKNWIYFPHIGRSMFSYCTSPNRELPSDRRRRAWNKLFPKRSLFCHCCSIVLIAWCLVFINMDRFVRTHVSSCHGLWLKCFDYTASLSISGRNADKVTFTKILAGRK